MLFANVSFATAVFNFSNNSFIYDGIQFPSSNFINVPDLSISNCGPSTTRTVTYTYEGVSPTIYPASTTPPFNAGSYTIRATINGGSCDLQFSAPYSYTIAPANLIITASNVNRTYGGAILSNSAGSLSFTTSGLQNNETIGSVTILYATGLGSGNEITSSVATYVGMIAAMSPTGGTFSSSNYYISYAPGNIVVIPATLTITAVNKTKVYGSANPTLTYSYSGLVNGDIAPSTLPIPNTAAVTGSPVGSYTITLSGASDPNYTIDYVNGTLSVTSATLTITAVNKTKVYGSANPTLTYSYSGLVNGDIAPSTLPIPNTAAVTGSPVGSYTITLSGASDPNYTIDYVNGTLSVTSATLTVSVTALDKVYNGNNTASVTLTDNRIAGDVLTINKTEATFNNKNIGIGKSVSVSGISLTGADAGNYTLTSSTATGTASITVRSLTITATISDKVYDGNTTANATLTDNRIAEDVFTVDKTATFNNKNIGTGKAVSVSGISLTGTDAGNYTYTSAIDAGTASITVRSLTISATTSDKVYDGNTNANVTLTDNRISGDVFTVDKTATFNNKNIGTDKAVAVSGITLTGTDAGNYTLTNATTTSAGTASITVRSLTITATVLDKMYDGNTTANATLTDNRVTGDDLTVNKTATFNNKNIGTGKTVSVSGISLTGTDAGNYTYTSAIDAGTASITVRSLTISATTSDKVYDGNTNANVTLTDNRISGDVFTVDKTATFNNKNIGTDKAVAVSGITLTGTDAGNYTLTNATTTSAGTASITVRSLTITATVLDKMYDGNTTANATLTDNRVTGDDLTVNKTATFNNKNIGTGKAVTVSGIILTGTDAGNYTITNTTAAGTASITIRNLTISATVLDKVYDGNANATATLTDNKLTGDDLTLNKTGVTFNNKNVGSGKTFTVTGITLTGTDAGNYTITNATATGTASITAKSLTITATAANKEYDGNVNAVVVFSDNRISGDVLTVNKTGSKFNDKNTGVGKAINITGINLTGVDAGNYSLTSSTITGTASITARGITISAIAMSKPYDGNKIAAVTLSDDKISGDIITPLYTLAEFDTKEIGNNKTVTVTGISIQGLDVLNYNLNNITATANANITGNPNAILIFPNAFTPNGDGNNDIFKIASSNTLGKASFLYFEIYNRNGQLMGKRYDNINDGWDGKHKDVIQDMGIYFVKLVKMKDGKQVVENAQFYLLK